MLCCAIKSQDQHDKTGSIDGLSDVIQIPSRLFASQGSSAQLKCDHTLGSNYYQMYWYRQEQVSLTQIVYTVADTKPDFGSFSEEKYSAEKKNYASGSFTVKNLTADDSGSYFCVVLLFVMWSRILLISKNQDEFAEIRCAYTVKSYEFMGYLNLHSPKPETEYEEKITLSDSVISNKVRQSPSDPIKTRGDSVEFVSSQHIKLQ
ncbi:hypothetical protein SRHO_G00138020 [Serrasalmus rhombeus]